MRKEVVVLPKIQKELKTLGENIRLARLRRNFSMELIAERAQISRPTLSKIEKGAPDVAIGYYAKVLAAIGGLDKELENIAKDDETGRLYLEMNLKVNKRASKRHFY